MLNGKLSIPCSEDGTEFVSNEQINFSKEYAKYCRVGK